MKDITHIAVLRNDVLGDVALSCPLFTKIKQQWPHATLTVIVQEVTAPLLTLHPAVDHIITDYRQTHRASFPILLNTIVSALKKQQFDMIFFPKMDALYVWAAFLAKIPCRVGDKQQLLLNPLLTHKVPIIWHDFTRHESEQQCQLLSPFNQNLTNLENLDCELIMTDQMKDAVKKKFALPDKEFILVHPGFGKGNRGWDALNYAKCIDRIHEETPYQVIVTGTGHDSYLTDVICQEGYTNPINLSNKTTLLELITLITLSKAVIGAETGPVHIAALLKKPIVSISPTKYIQSFRWGPLNTNHVIVKKNGQCPLICHTYKTECKQMHCIDPIQVDDVVQSLQFIIKQTTFPKLPKHYWFKTNATVAIHVTDVTQDLSTWVDLLKRDAISLLITTTNKAVKQHYEASEITVFYAPAIQLHHWINTLAINNVTVWQFQDTPSSSAWVSCIQKAVALKIDREPLVLSKPRPVSTIKELIDQYFEHANALTQKALR